MGSRGTETEFELSTIERLELQGFRYKHGEELNRPLDEVLLKDIFRREFSRRYQGLPDAAIDAAANTFFRPDGVNTIRRNMNFHSVLTRGIEVKVKKDNDSFRYQHIYAIDWDNPQNNDFLVVNQISIRGRNDRRPDIIIFINGLPLVVFELKNPYDEKPTVANALNQIAHYRNDIPQLFDYNAIIVVSDGVTTLHGMWTSLSEWYAPWKSIDGFNVEANTTGSMKTLIEGLFPKERLLFYIRNFILFEVVGDTISKKGAKYHQFFAARLAAQKAISTIKNKDDKRIGVIWHTTGSGKSLSMIFLVGILRRDPELQNPSFVIEVDRTDLDGQLYNFFNSAKSLVGYVKHAESVDELRDLLKTEGGEVILTTIEKFRLKSDKNGVREVEHPVLSKRSNIIIIADEAHRSQYGFDSGYARYLTDALPNAHRLGFTGTPINFSGASTVAVFGDLIHTYDIKQSEEDKTTVPIFYTPRQIKLHLNKKYNIEAALEEITEGYDITYIKKRKGRWATLAKAAGTKNRLQDLARDLLTHFKERTSTLKGKALIVCMSRENCVRLYNELTVLPESPEVKIVMTGRLGEDPEEWSRAGHITTKFQRENIKKRLIDPDDTLQIVIVCDMWLTGTNIPCLHTMYIDKPMKGHSIIQAISRVNRVFRDKPHGLIVDYIGMGDELREATQMYTTGGGKGDPAPEVEKSAKPIFLKELETIRCQLPEDINYGDWRRLSRIELEDQYSLVYGLLTQEEEKRDFYLQTELRLSKAYLLVKHLDDCRPYADEVIFYQRVRKQLLKTIPGYKPRKELEKAMRDLVDDIVETEEIVNIYEVVGITRPDISILDDEFLQTYKDKPLQNLRVILLEKLLRDEITRRRKRNIAKAKTFRELLEKTLHKYHNRLIDAASVIKTMIEIHKEIEDDDKRAAELGLSEEELAFYDSVAANFENLYGQSLLKDIIHDVVLVIKRKIRVDWTKPHREDVKAEVRTTVKIVLRNKKVQLEDFNIFFNSIMAQAEALYGDWPLIAS